MNEEMNTEIRPDVPLSHRVYGSIIHWLTILSSLMALFTPLTILIRGGDNLLNPYTLFSEVFRGASVSEIWAQSQVGSFPGAHYYLGNLAWGDSWGMLAVVVGCSVGLFAVVPAVIIQFIKEKDYLYAILGSIFGLLILLSMLGVLSIQAG